MKTFPSGVRKMLEGTAVGNLPSVYHIMYFSTFDRLGQIMSKTIIISLINNFKRSFAWFKSGLR